MTETKAASKRASRRAWTACLSAIATVIVAMWMSAGMRGYPVADGLLHSGLRSPVLALELVHDERELASVLGRGHAAEASIADLFRRSTQIDCLFIPVYAVLIVSFLRLVFDGGGVWKFARQACIAMTLAAAAADFGENWGIFQALDAPTLGPADAARIFQFAVAKWGLPLAVSALSGAGLILRGSRTPFGPVAARLAGAGILAGVFLAARATRELAFAERSLTLIAGAVLPACLIAPLLRRD